MIFNEQKSHLLRSLILLNRITYQDIIKRNNKVPPLVLSSQCNSALEWKNIGIKIGEDLNVGRVQE